MTGPAVPWSLPVRTYLADVPGILIARELEVLAMPRSSARISPG